MDDWAASTFLGSLTSEDRKELMNLGESQEFRLGDSMICQGGRGNRVYVLLSGAAKITGSTIDGKSLLLDVRVSGELIGEIAALDDRPRSATVTAACPVRTRSIRQREFFRFLDDHPAAWRELARAISAKVRLTTEYQLTFNVRSVPVRVAHALLYLTQRWRIPCAQGERVGVPLTHTEIAELIGSSQPDVQRAFAYLRGKGAVRTEYRSQIITDRKLLEQIANMADNDQGRA
jgi:CRP-like cAMP-binding protein